MRKPPDEKEAPASGETGERKGSQSCSNVSEQANAVKPPITGICTLHRIARWLDAPPTFGGSVILGDRVVDLIVEERSYGPGHRFFVARLEVLGSASQGGDQHGHRL